MQRSHSIHAVDTEYDAVATEYLAPFDAQWDVIAARAEVKKASNENAGPSRRLGQRVCTHLPAVVISGRGRFEARVSNLSTSGCALDATPSVAECTDIQLVLDLGGRRPLTLEARRVRLLAGAIAFEFEGLADADRLDLAALIDEVMRANRQHNLRSQRHRSWSTKRGAVPEPQRSRQHVLHEAAARQPGAGTFRSVLSHGSLRGLQR